MKFAFDCAKEGYIYVTPDILYLEGPNKDYGFLCEVNRKCHKELQIVELNDGMEPSYWCQDEVLAQITSDEYGCYVDWKGSGILPLTFAERALEGNYKIKATLFAEEQEEVLVFAGRRRLLYQGQMNAGEKLCVQGLVNVSPIVPRNHSNAMKDDTVDVTILGKGVHIVELIIEPWEGRTAYIAGDSTVTDQSAAYPYYPWNSYCGWGQMLSAYLQDEMAVSNHAHSGLTTESFRKEGHYQILIERIQPDDLCLIQFGHNDQKLMELKAYEGYKTRMLEYIREIKGKGAIPILVSPLARNSWLGNGQYNDLLEEYQAACKDIAIECSIPYVELHDKSMEFVTSLGRDQAKRYFFPSDYTHSNDYGAYKFAGFVYDELIRNKLISKKLYSSWEPEEVFEQIVIPKEYADKKPPVNQELFDTLERPEENLTRAEALEMVIATMRFFPTNVYNDMFEDVIGHETYAGSVECAWQNGLIPQSMIDHQKFYPTKEITGDEFFEILWNGYQSRKSADMAEEQRIKALICLKGKIKRKEAAKICSQMQI